MSDVINYKEWLGVESTNQNWLICLAMNCSDVARSASAGTLNQAQALAALMSISVASEDCSSQRILLASNPALEDYLNGRNAIGKLRDYSYALEQVLKGRTEIGADITSEIVSGTPPLTAEVFMQLRGLKANGLLLTEFDEVNKFMGKHMSAADCGACGAGCGTSSGKPAETTEVTAIEALNRLTEIRRAAG